MSAPAFSLQDSRQKVTRARHHLADLEQSIDEYFKTDWYEVKLTQCAPDEELDFTIETTIKGRPLNFSEIAGDTIHNLRAALDLMAVSVVAANGGNTNGVLFPFCDNADFLDQIIKKRNFHRASKEAVDEIRKLKPFKGGNLALRALHDLDIQDKHHSLVPMAKNVTTPQIGPATDSAGNPLGFAQGKLQFEIKGSDRPTVIFIFPNGGPLAQQPIVPTLHELVKLVSGILDTFEAIIS